LAFELLAISDADCIGPDGRADNALVQKQRLQADTRKWLLSKLLPRQTFFMIRPSNSGSELRRSALSIFPAIRAAIPL